MSTQVLRARAAAQDAIADKLAEMAARLAGQLAHYRKTGDEDRAYVAERRLSAAERGEARALFRAMGLRLAASAIGAREQRFGALAEIVRRAA